MNPLFSAAAQEKTADDELRRCDLLERALDVRAADKQVADAQAAVEKQLISEHASRRSPANEQCWPDSALR